MTLGEMQRAIMKHCRDNGGNCSNCKLYGRGGCYHTSDKKILENYNLLFGPEAADKTEAADERGANNMEKKTITIELERYEELVKKEAIFDKLTESSDVYVYLSARLEEVKTNA